MKKTTLFGNSVIFNSAYYVADEKGKRLTQNFVFQAEAEEAKARNLQGSGRLMRLLQKGD